MSDTKAPSLKNTLLAFLNNPEAAQNNPSIVLKVIKNSPLQVCDDLLDYIPLKRIASDFGQKTGFNQHRQFKITLNNWEWIYDRDQVGYFHIDMLIRDYS